MKYKKGDRVRIVSTKGGNRDIVPPMEEYLNKIMTIESVYPRGYYMEEDGGKWSRHKGSIEGLAEDELKEGDIVYVSDESQEAALGYINEYIYLYRDNNGIHILVHNDDNEDYMSGKRYRCFSCKYAVKKPKEEKKVTIELTEQQLEKIKHLL